MQAVSSGSSTQPPLVESVACNGQLGELINQAALCAQTTPYSPDLGQNSTVAGRQVTPEHVAAHVKYGPTTSLSTATSIDFGGVALPTCFSTTIRSESR